MSKTRKSISKRLSTKKTDTPLCCETTFQGLHNWYHHMFEHLGWMILAKQYNNDEKVISYLHSIERLHNAIEHRMTHTH